MCQSRARGGRRCPSHRQDTKQLIRFAQDHSTRNGYGREVFHDLFVDLRRTYRGVEMNETQRTVLTGEINEFLMVKNILIMAKRLQILRLYKHRLS